MMQSDLETVVIRLDLSIIDQTIHFNEVKLGEAREALLNNNINESVADRRKSRPSFCHRKLCKFDSSN